MVSLFCWLQDDRRKVARYERRAASSLALFITKAFFILSSSDSICGMRMREKAFREHLLVLATRARRFSSPRVSNSGRQNNQVSRRGTTKPLCPAVWPSVLTFVDAVSLFWRLDDARDNCPNVPGAAVSDRAEFMAPCGAPCLAVGGAQ